MNHSLAIDKTLTKNLGTFQKTSIIQTLLPHVIGFTSFGSRSAVHLPWIAANVVMVYLLSLLLCGRVHAQDLGYESVSLESRVSSKKNDAEQRQSSDLRVEKVSISDDVKQFLRGECFDCHQGDDASAGLDLESSLLGNNAALSFTQWVLIHDRVADHEMPPPEDAAVDSEDRQSFLESLGEDLRQHEAEQSDPLVIAGSRRLTNLQLERTLHDLLAIATPLANLLPDEQRTDGFTGVAASQSISHFLLESHLTVVDTAIDAAMSRLLDSETSFVRNYSARNLARDNPNRRCRDPEMIEDRAVVWSSGLVFYGRITSTTVRNSGWYRIRFTASAVKRPKVGGVWCSVRSGQCNSGAPLMDWIGSFEAMDEPTEHVMEAWLPAGHMIEIRPADATLRRASFRGGQVGAGEGGPQNVPGVALHSMQIEGIYPGGDRDQVRRRLFGEMPIDIKRSERQVIYVGSDPVGDSTKQLLDFAKRAFRRDVKQEEIAQYLNWLKGELESGKDPIDALLSSYRAILCSSRFLYLMEPPGKLDREAVASRLSYFLWGSMPDDALFDSAQRADFLEPENLVAHVERMLGHPRGKQFVGDFASQWLDLMDIDFTEPDRKLYPDFDIVVQNAMLDETQLFLQWLLDQNAPIDQLLHSDATFLNSRLASYYGVDGVSGDRMRLVSLDQETHRGGLLAHGSILKVTANGTNTSPVLRGVWVSDRLLGVKVPPPPDNVPAVEPDIRGATTIREQLQLHLSHDDCRGCHAKMDPPGYALENFDAAGRWRENYEIVVKGRSKSGAVIDPSGKFLDGREFSSFQEFRDQLGDKPLPIAQNFAEKLIIYATGAPLSFSDRRELKAVLELAEEDHFGIRSLLKHVVTSSLFLTQ